MDYSSLTRKELTAICKEKCIIGYSKKNKQKIIEMIQEDIKEDTKEVTNNVTTDSTIEK